MKIKKNRVREIIREELSRIYEQENNDLGAHASKNIRNWSNQILNLYKPGSQNSKNISAIISQSNISYEDFYNILKKRINFTFFWENQSRENGKWLLKFGKNLKDSHGARGIQTGKEATGDVTIALDSDYWLSASEAQQRRLLFHEIEHAISTLIGKYAKDWNEKWDDFDLYFGNKANATGRASGEKSQVALYKNIFHIDNVPDWALDRGSSQKAKKMSNFAMKSPIGSGVLGSRWGGKHEEQRSMIKSLLAQVGGTMTQSMLDGLCKEKSDAQNFNWENANASDIEKYLKAVEDRSGFPLIGILYLNCEDKNVIEDIMKVAALDKPGNDDQESSFA